MQYLDDFNLNSSKEMKLVFFMDAIQHVSRYVCVCLCIRICLPCSISVTKK